MLDTVVVQPVVWIVHEYVAGVGSVLPAPSVAVTLNVCEPVARLE
jgi:hypothetical protein